MAWCNISEVFVFLAGIVGNGATCWAIARTWSQRPSLNMYLMLITLTDLVDCLLLPVIYISFILYDEWIFSMTFCYIYVYFEMFLVFFNLFLLLAAFVTFSLVRSPPFRTSCITIGSLFLLAVFVTAPRDLVHEKHCFQDVGFHCATLLFKVIVPALLVCLFFAVKSAKPERAVNIFSELRVHRLTLAIIASHIAISFPITYSTAVMELSNDHYYDVFAQLFATVSLAVKPFLYYWLDEVLRNEFSRMMEMSFRHSISRTLMNSNDEFCDH